MICLNIPGLPAGVDGWAFLLFFGALTVFVLWSLNPGIGRRWLHTWSCPVCHAQFWTRDACENHVAHVHWRAS